MHLKNMSCASFPVSGFSAVLDRFGIEGKLQGGAHLSDRLIDFTHSKVIYLVCWCTLNPLFTQTPLNQNYWINGAAIFFAHTVYSCRTVSEEPQLPVLYRSD